MCSDRDETQYTTEKDGFPEDELAACERLAREVIEPRFG